VGGSGSGSIRLILVKMMRWRIVSADTWRLASRSSSSSRK
jgi:hypothetical protein